MSQITKESQNLTVMFLDLVGYTNISSKLDRENLFQLQDVFDQISLPLFKHHHGKMIKKMGDAFLVTFKSPTNAILCGIDLQKRFKLTRKKETLPLKVRIALHSGEIISKNKDIYGDAVNTTARIESITKAGDIVFSENVYQAMNKNEIPTIYIGKRKFKGVKNPIKLFRVKKKYDNLKKTKRELNYILKKIFKTFILTMIIIAILYILIKLL